MLTERKLLEEVVEYVYVRYMADGAFSTGALCACLRDFCAGLNRVGIKKKIIRRILKSIGDEYAVQNNHRK